MYPLIRWCTWVCFCYTVSGKIIKQLEYFWIVYQILQFGDIKVFMETEDHSVLIELA